MSPTSKPTKKTIYVDADEEITSIIDKTISAIEPVVALVIPKRATVFESIVNMKLLKRAVAQNHKRVVLISSDPTLLPLAGLVGIHTAPNLNSKPFIPKAPEVSDHQEQVAPSETIELKSKRAPAAGAAAIGAAAASKNSAEDTIAVDKPSKEPVDTKIVAKDKSKKKLKVPNFGRFRKWLIAGVALLIALIAFGYWAFAIAPSAVVSIKGEANNEELAFKFSANTEAKKVDKDKSIVPAVVEELKKIESENVPATGEKNNGNKASGSVTLKNCGEGEGSVNIPAGTTVSSGDLDYITQEKVKLPPSKIVNFGGNKTCESDTKDVNVIAAEGGEKYNTKEGDYSVAGFSGVDGDGSEMAGGTDNMVKVVSQSDIDKAKTNLETKLVGATEELKASLRSEGFIGLEDTLQSAPGEYRASPKVDAVADEVVVNVEIVYSMLGINQGALEELIEHKAQTQANIDTNVQTILDNGLSKAQYQLGANDGVSTEVNIVTNIVTGPEIDEQTVKGEVAGLKRGIAEQQLKERPGITEVIIVTKPFWNYSIPKDPGKIQINVEGSSNNNDEPANP